MFIWQAQADVAGTKAMVDQIAEQCAEQELQLNTFQKEQMLPTLEKIASLISSHAITITDLSDTLSSKVSTLMNCFYGVLYCFVSGVSLKRYLEPYGFILETSPELKVQ